MQKATNLKSKRVPMFAWKRGFLGKITKRSNYGSKTYGLGQFPQPIMLSS